MGSRVQIAPEAQISGSQELESDPEDCILRTCIVDLMFYGFDCEEGPQSERKFWSGDSHYFSINSQTCAGPSTFWAMCKKLVSTLVYNMHWLSGWDMPYNWERN